MAESKICGTVVDGHPVQVKVIVDFQRIADKLAAKARKQKNGKASDCHGCVKVEVVPVKRAIQTSGIQIQKTAGLSIVKAIDNKGIDFMREFIGQPTPGLGDRRWAVAERSVFDLKAAAARAKIGVSLIP